MFPPIVDANQPPACAQASLQKPSLSPAKLSHWHCILRLFHTLRELKFRQLIFMIVRRLLPDFYRPPAIYHGPDQPLTWADFNCGHHVSIVDHHFLFLNHLSTFSTQNPDWRGPNYPKLWRYNLHYFDFLQDNIAAEEKAHLIDDWIRHNALGCEDAWEPYPVSLRIVNWIKYFSSLSATAMPGHWHQSLYLQGHWLSKNLEYHIDANHLFKNIAAMVIWSHYFCGAYPAAQRIKSLQLFRQELCAQFNSDGSHYERSPMYHCVVLHFAMDVFNLLHHNSQEDLSDIQAVLQKALRYLSHIILPNGRIPLLKDSAYGIAPEPLDLIHYGQRLGLLPADYVMAVSNPELQTVLLEDAGYFVARQEQNYLLFDTGTASPSHQPGHAHCDALHIELVLQGQAIFCDTGVYCYEGTSDRHYCRSTAAHNTLRINQNEQSDIWGQFRLGGRSQTHLKEIDTPNITAAVTHFSYGGKPFVHQRRITLNDFDHIVVEDRVTGEDVCDIEIFWHLAPELTVEIVGDCAIVKDKNKTALAVIKTQQISVKSSIQRSEYFPEFGIRQSSQTLVLFQSNVRPPWSLSTKISPIFAVPPLDEA